MQNEKMKRLQAKSWEPHKLNWWLVGIMLLGAFLRLLNLGEQSFWMDEIQTVRQVSLPWAELIYDMKWHLTGPFPVFIQRWLITPLGMNEFTARLPSSFFSIATIYLVYKLGKNLTTKRIGLIAALLISVNPYHIYYAQEVRPYAHLTFFVGLSYLSLFSWFTKNQSSKWFISYILSSILSIYTHPSGIVMLVPHVGIVLILLTHHWHKNGWGQGLKIKIFKITLSWLAIALLVTPMIILINEGSQIYGTLEQKLPISISFWVRSFFSNAWDKVILPFSAHNWPNQLIGGVLGFIFSIAILLGLTTTTVRFNIETVIYLGAWCVLPFLLLTATSYRSGIGYVPRYSNPLLSAYLLVIAVAIYHFGNLGIKDYQLSPRLLMGVLALAIILFNLPLLIRYYQGEKTNYQNGAEFLEEQVFPGDIIVYQSMDIGQYEYYFSNKAKQQIRNLNSQEIATRCNGTQRVWLTGSHILNPIGKEQFAWAEENMEHIISFPAFTEWGTVDVFRCGIADIQDATVSLERKPPSSRTATDWLKLGELHFTLGHWKESSSNFEKGIDKCLVEECAPHALFRMYLGYSQSLKELGDLSGAVDALNKAISLSVPIEFLQAYRQEISELYELYIEEYLDDEALSYLSVSGGTFEKENDLTNWRFPQLKYALEANVTSECAAVGKMGAELKGSTNIYHNGINISLPDEVISGRFFAVGAYMRAKDEGNWLYDHILIDPLYLGGQDKTGSYHGSIGTNKLAAERFVDWQLVVRVFPTDDWLDKTLYVSPALLTGRGSVCIDQVFVIPLPIPRQLEAEILLAKENYLEALQLFDDLLQKCVKDECTSKGEFSIRVKIAKAKAALGKEDEAYFLIHEAFEKVNPTMDLIEELIPDIESLYQMILMARAIPNTRILNGSFEENFSGWNPPAERYDLTLLVDESCTYRGMYGLFIEGANNNYHNGPSVALPFAEQGQYYLFGAMVRQLGNVVKLESMYLGGHDNEGEYRGSHGGELDDTVNAWKPIVRLVKTPDWTDFRLSPLLLTGNGPVCLDEVFAISLIPID
jgi:uncharacterized membrane protein